MARSVYFSEKFRPEQELYENIVIESLKIYGQNMYYLPRDIINQDRILTEDPSSRFDSSYMIEMYVDNVDGFDGQGDLFTKFGVEIRDQVTLTVARRRWSQAVERYDNEITTERPMEGDLIYVPFSRKLFQIMAVEHEMPFYQLNNLPVYKLRCELYEFSSDQFDTGVEVIDEIEAIYAYKYILQLERAAAAQFEGQISGGKLTNITVLSPGEGYNTLPEINISAPDLPARNAVAEALLDSDGYISDINITDPGLYYTITPVVSIEVPSSNEVVKFGSNSLFLASDSVTVPTFQSRADAPVIQERVSLSFWIYPTTSQTHGVIFFNNVFKLYVDGATNKIVIVSSNGASVTSTSSVNFDQWNFIDVNTVGSSVRIDVNGIQGSIVTNIVTFLPAGTVTYSGNASSQVTFAPSIVNGFIGYIDHFVNNRTGDTSFRNVRAVPITASEQATDPTTNIVAPAGLINTFDTGAPSISTTVVNGQVVGIAVSGGPAYVTPPSVNIDPPRGIAAQFTATAVATISGDTISSVTVTYGGNGYSEVPSVTVAVPDLNDSFNKGDIIYQAIDSDEGIYIKGEVVSWDASTYKLELINVGATDGKYHSFLSERQIRTNAPTGIVGPVVGTVVENQSDYVSNQNSDFSSEMVDFLDFSESNPFGDPENN